MSLKELIAAIVVDLPIRPDGQEVLQHGLRRVQTATVDGPEEGREGLGAHLQLINKQNIDLVLYITTISIMTILQ